MKLVVSLFLCLGGMLVLTPVGRARSHDAVPDISPAEPVNAPAEAANDQPYSAIWVRNVFNLLPTPPPATNNNQAATPPLNVRLIGITTIFGNKRATLGVQEGGKDKQKEEYYTMTEGERHGGLELLEINPNGKTPTVKIKKEESISTLTFETNKSVGPGPMAGGPQPLTMPGYGQPHPAGMSSGNGPQSAPLPNRMMRAAPPGYGQPNVGTTGYSSGYNGAIGGAPVANTSYNPGSNLQAPQNAPPAAPNLTPQQQAALQAMHEDIINNHPAPPLPPGFAPPSPPGGTSSGGPTTPVPSLPPGLLPRTTGNFR